MDEGRMTDEAKVPEKKESAADMRTRMAELKKKLARQEALEHAGAPSRMPKEKMLDARAIEARDPDHHYRFVGTMDPGKVDTRKREGYEVVPEAEARAAGVDAKHEGVDVLMRQPIAKHERRVAEIAEATRTREAASRAEFERAVESAERTLRDQHGIKAKLLIDEGE